MRNGKVKKSVDEDEVSMKATVAGEVLGISKKKLAALLSSGALPFERDSLDSRVKRVRKSDVRRLQQQGLGKVA